MSTLMNYTFQSFNFRGRSRMRPFYDLIANIAAEEFAHIELVSYTINLLLSGSTKRGSDPSAIPRSMTVDSLASIAIMSTRLGRLIVPSTLRPEAIPFLASSPQSVSPCPWSPSAGQSRGALAPCRSGSGSALPGVRR